MTSSTWPSDPSGTSEENFADTEPTDGGAADSGAAADPAEGGEAGAKRRGRIPHSAWPDILARNRAGATLSAIAREFDCTPSAIAYIVRKAEEAGMEPSAAALSPAPSAAEPAMQPAAARPVSSMAPERRGPVTPTSVGFAPQPRPEAPQPAYGQREASQPQGGQAQGGSAQGNQAMNNPAPRPTLHTAPSPAPRGPAPMPQAAQPAPVQPTAPSGEPAVRLRLPNEAPQQPAAEPAEDIETRFGRTAEDAITAYRAWAGVGRSHAAQPALSDALHELRRVMARMEIEIAMSQAGDTSQRPIPIPLHRAHKRGP